MKRLPQVPRAVKLAARELALAALREVVRRAREIREAKRGR